MSSLGRGETAFTRFLDEGEKVAALQYIRSCGWNCSCVGGYDDAERCVIAIAADEGEPCRFPITALSFSISTADIITHRDVLGAIMSLGVKRDQIGDILFIDECCYFFVISSIADYIVSNFTSVARAQIHVKLFDRPLSYQRVFESADCIVSSMRVDCVLSSLLKCSRNNAIEVLDANAVKINGSFCTKHDRRLEHGDVLSVRRHGKYRIETQDGVTKKGRIKLKVLKYV